MPEREVLDQAVRDRVTTDLGTTFLLEAGAGTGKTRVLVDRYVRCVLDAEHGTGDVRTVAAITFTEKAAGELRQRVREEFERRAAQAPDGSDETAVIERALDALDDAPISTIHGFAGRLLREFPVEAGVDPAFEQLDALTSEIELARFWDEWMSGLAACDPEEGGAAAMLARLLRAGVRLDDVRKLAVGAGGVFGERYDLDPAPDPGEEPDLAAALDELTAPLARLREFSAAACADQGDRAFCTSVDLVEQCEALLAERPADLDRIASALYALELKVTPRALGGRQENWSAALGAKDELWERYSAASDVVTALRDAYATYLTDLAVAAADAFARWAGAAQLSQGRLDFTDLLGCLRDLLARDRAARAALQRRFRYLLVDEFQDTDPLQAEIVFLLCERAPDAADWRQAVLEPGKLFVVGDPKQSIYRFRRADIGLYDEVKRCVARQPGASGEVLAISQNFRTTPSLVGWVNNVFADAFERDQEEGRQPGYQWVDAYRPPAEGPRVAVLLGREYATRAGGESEAARRDEAGALAGLLVAMHAPDAGWHVQDRGAGAAAGAGATTGAGAAAGAGATTGAGAAAAAEAATGAGAAPGDGEPTRPPRWGDVAVLFRSTTGLETYELALREAGVPYRVEGGKTYFARREVADALLCLRAVDDPSDGPALYGALHSSLFGFSDDDLFLFWAAGGRFDVYAETQPAGHEAVAEALAVLRALGEGRGAREPHEVVGELVRVARSMEFLAASGPGGAQAIANLEKLIERARAFAHAGGGGLGAFLSWAAEAGDAAGEQESQVGDEGDVVHLLTIHKAKGLEYPIVVLAGGALPSGGGRGEPIVDRAARRLAVKLKAELPGAAARDLVPPAYRERKEHEKRMDESESRRLLYVAATRARDRLVIAQFGKLTSAKGEAAAVLLGAVKDALPEAGARPPAGEYEDDGLLVLAPAGPPAPAVGREAPDLEALIAARTAWIDGRAVLLDDARRPARATSPSGLEHVDDEARDAGSVAPAGRATALALGSAVHRIMELCDLADATSVERVAAAAVAEMGRPDLAGEAAALAGACWRAAPVRAAAAAAAAGPDCVFRELPIGVLVDGAVVAGAIDLVYRDGADWVIVDYKTDRDPSPEQLRERYGPQGAAYALAVEAATGDPVREVVFVAARAEGTVARVPVDEALRTLARNEVGAAAAAGRALRPDELADD